MTTHPEPSLPRERGRGGRLVVPRPPWVGLPLGPRPLLMGIVNVTPDSFSDGVTDASAAVALGRQLLAEGADILDVGGESTRPGAAPVDADEEASRVVPVIAALAAAGAVVSVDTRNASTMAAAIAAGARIVNDVSALAHDPAASETVARSGAGVVLMHMRGEPRTMMAAARYGDVVREVADALAERSEAAEKAGIARDRIVLDPGLGFAKTAAHNIDLLRGLDGLHALGCGLLIGASRKSFIGRLHRDEGPRDRLPGSLAAALAAVSAGAHVLRVHDVAATRQALAVALAIADGVPPVTSGG